MHAAFRHAMNHMSRFIYNYYTVISVRLELKQKRPNDVLSTQFVESAANIVSLNGMLPCKAI